MKLNSALLSLLVFLTITFASCQAIGDIFKAGFWSAIIVVVLVVIIIIWLISKFRSRS